MPVLKSFLVRGSLFLISLTNQIVTCFLVDYEAIMEERKRIADEEERKRKEYELKVNSMEPKHLARLRNFFLT